MLGQSPGTKKAAWKKKLQHWSGRLHNNPDRQKGSLVLAKFNGDLVD
jgi:hypothetical protein